MVDKTECLHNRDDKCSFLQTLKSDMAIPGIVIGKDVHEGRDTRTGCWVRWDEITAKACFAGKDLAPVMVDGLT